MKLRFIVLAIDHSSFVYVWTNEGWVKISSIAIGSQTRALIMDNSEACKVRDHSKLFGTVKGVKYHIMQIAEVQ